MPLFQITYFWKDSGQAAGDNRILIIVLGVLFGAFILVALVSYLKKKVDDAQHGAPRKPVNLNTRSVQRSAQSSGFSGVESEFLAFYAQKLSVFNYREMLKDSDKLDHFLRDVYHYIEKNSKTETEAEELKKKLFMIREAHSFRMHSSKTIQSTHEIPRMTPFSLVTAKDAHYATILLSNDSDGLYVEYPRDAFGEFIKFPAGAKLTVYFYTGNHAGFQFKTVIREKLKSKSTAMLKLKHTHSVVALPYRKHERKPVRMECTLYRVNVRTSGTGSSARRLVQSDTTPLPGIITDISAGGISFHSGIAMMPGDIIKTEFNPGLGRRIAYTSIIRVNKIRNGYLYHAKFVKAETRTIQEIYALVYGYL